MTQKPVILAAVLTLALISSTGLPLTAGTYLTLSNVRNLGTSTVDVQFSLDGVLRFDEVLTASSVLSVDGTSIVGSFTTTSAFSEGVVTAHNRTNSALAP